MYRRRGFRGNPIGLIVLALFLMLAVGPYVVNMLEALLPLLFLIIIVGVASFVMFGAEPSSPIQQMMRNIFGSAAQQPRRQPSYWREQPSVPESNKTHDVADRAVVRAGYRPGDNPDIDLSDIGLLVYEGDNNPTICRLSDVPTNASHIRPFIVLDLPNLPDTGGNGVIRFNLIDKLGKLRYTARSRYSVKRGQNFITPKTWLPLANQTVGDEWTIQVCVGEGTPFAIHEFEWMKIGGEVRSRFTGDGEIDELMQPSISQSAEEQISLDELLESQGEAAPLTMNARR